jgi:hypothetical protein
MDMFFGAIRINRCFFLTQSHPDNFTFVRQVRRGKTHEKLQIYEQFMNNL